MERWVWYSRSFENILDAEDKLSEMELEFEITPKLFAIMLLNNSIIFSAQWNVLTYYRRSFAPKLPKKVKHAEIRLEIKHNRH